MKIYQINDIIPELTKPTENYVGIFEDTPDPEIEWPHRHTFYSLVLFTQGSGMNVIDFDEYEIQPNRIFTINPKQIHNWNYSFESCGYFLLIEEPLARKLNIEFSFPFTDIQKNDLHFIEEIFKRMLLKDNQQTAIPYLVSLLNNPGTSKKNNNITNFKKLVSENLDKNLTIEEYAEKLGISIETLTQTSKDETGYTPKQLQLDIKITEAKRLMLYTSLNTGEIAFKLGFEDNSYFSRIFKNKTNYSPAEFRKKYLKNKKKS